MKARQIIYSSTIIVLGFIQSVPAFMCLASTIILLNVLGVLYGILLVYLWRSTIIGRWFFRELWKIYTPLGEFHPAWSVRDLKSTIIVLGKFQPKNCSFNLGSTINITN